METINQEDKYIIKHKNIILKLKSLKNQYNNPGFTNNELLNQLDSYINLIKNIQINPNIDTIQIYLNSLLNLADFYNNNLNTIYEEKNHYYLNHDEFIKLILDKLNSLNYNKNDIIKINRRISDLKYNYSKNKELKLYMNIKNINNISIEECIKNPVFTKYISNDELNDINNINNRYNKFINNYRKYEKDLDEIDIINKKFIIKLKKCNIICKDMKKKYFCNKYLKNTEDNTIKIHNNIYNTYIKVFYDYFNNLSQSIIKKISEENLKLFRLNDTPKLKIKKEEKKIENKKNNNNEDLNKILNEGFKKAEGETEIINKNNNTINVLDLDEEFGEGKNIIINNNNNNNNINNSNCFEERKNNYLNLFDLNKKLNEGNRYNEYIIFNSTNIKKEFNKRIKEQEEEKNILENKYSQIIKYNREELNNEKKNLEKEYNNLKMKEKEYELIYKELKEKYEKKNENENIVININNNEEKNENEVRININNNNIIKKDEIKKEINEDINIKPKPENILEENKIINNNNKKNIDINNKPPNKEKKLISLLNKEIPQKKETIIINPKIEIKKEEIKKENMNESNNKVLNQENNPINNNPFSKEKEEEDKIIKQVIALNNLSSVLSNRSSSKNKKEISSPSPTIIKRRIHNDDHNIFNMLSGLNINSNKIINNSNSNNSFNKNLSSSKQSKKESNESMNKQENISNIFSSKIESSNIFSQINNNTKNNFTFNNNTNFINSNNQNNKNQTNNPNNIFTNTNNLFNTNTSNKPNPFSIISNNNINNNTSSNPFNFLSKSQNVVKTEQNTNIFKNINIPNNTNENIFQIIIQMKIFFRKNLLEFIVQP